MVYLAIGFVLYASTKLLISGRFNKLENIGDNLEKNLEGCCGKPCNLDKNPIKKKSCSEECSNKHINISEKKQKNQKNQKNQKKKFSSAYGTIEESKRINPLKIDKRIGSALGVTHSNLLNIFGENLKVLSDVDSRFVFNKNNLTFNDGNSDVILNAIAPEQNKCARLISKLGFSFNMRSIDNNELEKEIIPSDNRFKKESFKVKRERFGNPIGITLESDSSCIFEKNLMVVIPDLFYEIDDAILCGIISLIGISYMSAKKAGKIDKKMDKEIKKINMIDFVELRKRSVLMNDDKMELLELMEHLNGDDYNEMIKHIVNSNDIGEA